jgi:glycosyltransferase involved in cell wall biosynthesis
MIHVCIPVHNEGDTIGVLLWKIRKVMAEFGRDYEVVVLNDASTDHTAETLDRYRHILPLRLLRSDARLGNAKAVERILRDVATRCKYPKRDVAVTIQGDFTESPDDLPALVKAVEGGADLVVGRVNDPEKRLPRSLRLARMAARFLLLWGRGEGPVTDPLSGYRAYRVVVLRKALRAPEVETPLQSRGWAGNVDLLSRTAPHARRIEETPVGLRLEPRARPSRFEAWEEFKALIPLRGRTWLPEVDGGSA